MGIIQPGDNVDYLPPAASGYTRWRSAKVTAVTDQTHLVLAIVDSSTNSRARVALNGGVAVPIRTAATQTNVWRLN
jgi:hypothetical protein